MGLLFGRVNVDDKDLAAIGVMVEETNTTLRFATKAIEKLAEAVQAIAAAVSHKKFTAFWGLVKME